MANNRFSYLSSMYRQRSEQYYYMLRRIKLSTVGKRLDISRGGDDAKS